MSIPTDDLGFLWCGVCATLVRVYAEIEQYACLNAHFVCLPCSKGGDALCGCGQRLKLVSEPDEEFTKVAPYYAKKLILSCAHCDFYTANQVVLDGHTTISCASILPSPVTLEMKARTHGKTVAYPTENTWRVVRGAPQTRLTIQFEMVDVVINFVQKELQTRSRNGPFYAVLTTENGIAFAVFAGGTDYSTQTVSPLILQAPELVVTVGRVFGPIPRDPFLVARDTNACAKTVVAWQRHTQDMLRAQAVQVLRDGSVFEFPAEMDLPLGVRTEHLGGFGVLAKRLAKEAYRGGLLFYITGTTPESAVFINGFYLYLADGANGECVFICPGCFQGFHFTLGSFSICEHLRISPWYMKENATRYDLETARFLPKGMTPCMQRVHAASLEHEVRPGHDRLREDLLPMYERLHLPCAKPSTDVYYGIVVCTGGRDRLVSVMIETEEPMECEGFFEETVRQHVVCTICNNRLIGLPAKPSAVCNIIGAHFKLDRSIVIRMALMWFDLDKTSYSISKDHRQTLYSHPGLQ